jgi:translation initiation factor 2 beta subunit (eIF-2beta)/eIF-5
VQSGDTQSQEKENTYSLVESTLEDVENQFNQALKDYAAFKGEDNFDGKVILCKEITNDDYQEFIQKYNAFHDVVTSTPTLNKAVKKQIAGMFNLEDDELTKAIEEIDAAKEQNPQQQASPLDKVFGNGRPQPTA